MNPTIQADGVQTPAIIQVYYQGSDTLQPGQLVCYDWDHAGYTAGTTAQNLTENIRRRCSYVEKPSLNNIAHIAGYVAGGQPNLTGPRLINIVPIDQPDRLATLYTDASITAGDFLGIAPGSYSLNKWTVGPVLAVAHETVDRSTTAGTVRATWGLNPGITDTQRAMKRTEWVDDFMGGKTVAGLVAASVADNDAYLITGTTVVAARDDDASGGILEVTSTTTTPANLCLNGEPFSLAAGKPCFFRARFNLSSVAASTDFFIGLSITDTSYWSTLPTDYVGFTVVDGDINLTYVKDGTTGAVLTDTAVNAVANTFDDVCFYFDGKSTIRWFFNETQIAETTTAAEIPNDEQLTFEADVLGDAARTFRLDHLEIYNAR